MCVCVKLYVKGNREEEKASHVHRKLLKEHIYSVLWDPFPIITDNNYEHVHIILFITCAMLQQHDFYNLRT